MDELKSYAILMIIVCVCSFATVSYNDYTKMECRSTAMNHSYDAEKINAICK